MKRATWAKKGEGMGGVGKGWDGERGVGRNAGWGEKGVGRKEGGGFQQRHEQQDEQQQQRTVCFPCPKGMFKVRWPKELKNG